MPEYRDDARFNTIQNRRHARDVVNALISERTQSKTLDELVALFTEFEVPHAPILGVNEAVSQPHAVAREMVYQAEHATLGRIPMINRPFKFVGVDQAPPSAPPVLGQHTQQVLETLLNLDQQSLDELRSLGVIA